MSPRKNLYVKPEDTDVFERVEKLLARGESLGGLVVTLLKPWVRQREAMTDGFEEVMLPRDRDRPVKFLGKLLAEGTGLNVCRIYKTKPRDGRGQGRLVYAIGTPVIVRDDGVRQLAADGDVEHWSVDVYDALQEMSTHGARGKNPVPVEMIEEAAQTLGEDHAEWI
jgi:hypothetical protein